MRSSLAKAWETVLPAYFRSVHEEHNLRMFSLTLLALMVLKELHALESSTPCDELVAELGLVVVASATVHFLVGVLGLV